MTHKKGSQIDQFTVTGAPLGSGGMATVYPVKSSQGKNLALKLLHPHFNRDNNTRKRFRREFEIAVRMKSPAFVKVDSEIPKPQLGYTMEVIQGRTLETLLRRGLVANEEEVTAFALQILTAMCEFHDANYIHRDLKPDNIMITPSGQVKIMDYGVSREIGSNVTQTGAAVGTPLYMSPEQIHDSKGTDRRCDIYSIGLILYRFMTKKDAHNIGRKTALYELLKTRMEKDEIRNHTLLKNEGWKSILTRCLQPQPDKRFNDCYELLTAVKALKLCNQRQVKSKLKNMLKTFDDGQELKKKNKSYKATMTVEHTPASSWPTHKKIAVFSALILITIVVVLIGTGNGDILQKALKIILDTNQ